MLAPVTHILALTHIRRRRLLPFPGQVMVRLGQAVNPMDVIAQAPCPGSHLIVDVRRTLHLPASTKLDQVLLVHSGERVEKDMPIAEFDGFFKRIARSPENGTVVMIQGGRVVLETAPELFQVKAGFSGEVTEIIPDHGAWVETDGAQVQGVWGNDRHEAGLLLSRLNSPDDTLDVNRLDVSMRGGIIAAGHCASADVLKMAADIPLRGLILSSMTADLVPLAENLPIPIVVVEGFGNLPLDPVAYKILTTSNQREICLLANRWQPYAANRPEVIIPLNAPAESPSETTEFRAGQVVRITVGKNAGRCGKLSQIRPGVLAFASGVTTTAANLQLDDGSEICVPVSNLDVLE
jgi:hypothetical protein